MKTIISFFVMLFLTSGLFAVGVGSSNSDSKNNSSEKFKLVFGGFKDGVLSENSIVLFKFEEGDIQYVLVLERIDGEKILKENGVLKLPRNAELVTKATIINSGPELASYEIGFAFGDKNFRDILGVKSAILKTPDGSVKEYSLDKLFTSEGSFLPKIGITNLKTGKTSIEMISIKEKVVKTTESVRN